MKASFYLLICGMVNVTSIIILAISIPTLKNTFGEKLLVSRFPNALDPCFCNCCQHYFDN